MWYSEDPWEEARPLSLPPLTLQGTETPPHVCVSQDNQTEKLSPDKRALSGLKDVFMSPCRCLTETWKVVSEGGLVRGEYSPQYSDGAFRLDNTHIMHLSLSLPLLMYTRHSVLISNTHCRRVMAQLKYLYKFRLWKNYSGLSGN